jgi:hypothetical protein
MDRRRIGALRYLEPASPSWEGWGRSLPTRRPGMSSSSDTGRSSSAGAGGGGSMSWTRPMSRRPCELIRSDRTTARGATFFDAGGQSSAVSRRCCQSSWTGATRPGSPPSSASGCRGPRRRSRLPRTSSGSRPTAPSWLSPTATGPAKGRSGGGTGSGEVKPRKRTGPVSALTHSQEGRPADWELHPLMARLSLRCSSVRQHVRR